MEQLIERFYEKYAEIQTKTIRDFAREIDWSNRLIGIKGSRGVGKTTLLLQYIRKNYKPGREVLYVSLDHFYFSDNRLYDLAEEFYKKGGQFLAVDEVHRYPHWAKEVKNIYDDFSGLKMVFTGSSMLQLHKAGSDLSRRAVMYSLPGLSLREFINFESGMNHEKYSLREVLENHTDIAVELRKKMKPLSFFDNYLQYGFYPFYLENLKAFNRKLLESAQLVVELDIPQFENMQISHIVMIKKLLQIIATSVPFKPNLKSISERTGISINTLKLYLSYLNNANLISLLYVPSKGINSLNKPEKIYLENTNLMYALSGANTNKGNLRETFFFNQLKHVANNVNASRESDFLIDGRFTFEVGGKSKGKKQVKHVSDAFLAKDDIEIGHENIIPLWLFGFLY